MPYWVWLLVRIDIGKESSGTSVLLLLGRVQKSSQSRKQTDRQHSSSERKCVFQRCRKSSFKETGSGFVFTSYNVRPQPFFLMINNICSNEVGKLTGEHRVHEWCQRKWALWLLIIFFFKQWWFGKLALIKLCRSFHSRHGSLPCERGGGERGYFPLPQEIVQVK